MTTRLVIIRHGKPISDGYAEDALRPLSEEGKATQKKITNELKDADIKPNRILTSPLLRAVQTAEVVSEILDAPVHEEPALGNEFNSEILFKEIVEGETLALVGHAPTLAEFVETLVGSRCLPEGISKSGAVIVEFPEKIEWGSGKFIAYYHS